MPALSIVDQTHSDRQILPRSMAVSVTRLAPTPSTAQPTRPEHSTRRRFDDTDWRSSQLRRELRDRPSFTEAIVLEADHAITRFIDHDSKTETGRRVVMFAPQSEPLLTIAPEPPKAFEMLPSLQDEAAARLEAMRKRSVRRPIEVAPVRTSRVNFASVAIALLSIACVACSLLR